MEGIIVILDLRPAGNTQYSILYCHIHEQHVDALSTGGLNNRHLFLNSINDLSNSFSEPR